MHVITNWLNNIQIRYQPVKQGCAYSESKLRTFASRDEQTTLVTHRFCAAQAHLGY
ncbi:hypothetical protein CANARDRAFT_114368 [[Candida] arabinofermentans NRRL YB-2248]|uniref:Uncharacterized protein n=1 Tax=[Candida] arabinofermentans NRRL YB-2248 TaxID=983967 RepID=A0A1E4T4Q6_9ASCO|nr:hypothetical protein CANARDRAFT_114368 [[Candida] arabinofermentans NRRL YB-2248]